MSNIGKKISDRRKQLNLTLEQVGDAVGVGKSTVRKWENGMIKNMKMDKVHSLAKVLQMDPVEFVPGVQSDAGLRIIEVKGSAPKKLVKVKLPASRTQSFDSDLGLPSFKGAAADKDLEQVLQIWKSSTPGKRKEIVRVVKAMKEE